MSLNVKHIYEHGFATPEDTGSIFVVGGYTFEFKNSKNKLKDMF
jgi:hypothetical protein